MIDKSFSFGFLNLLGLATAAVPKMVKNGIYSPFSLRACS
jgi:hypothetical protein